MASRGPPLRPGLWKGRILLSVYNVALKWLIKLNKGSQLKHKVCFNISFSLKWYNHFIFHFIFHIFDSWWNRKAFTTLTRWTSSKTRWSGMIGVIMHVVFIQLTKIAEITHSYLWEKTEHLLWELFGRANKKQVFWGVHVFTCIFSFTLHKNNSGQILHDNLLLLLLCSLAAQIQSFQ